jgi:tetratricopeptide (TPR) repeat protein
VQGSEVEFIGELIFFLAPPIVALLGLWCCFRILRQVPLLMRGRIAEARADIEKLLASWLRRIPTVETSSRYNLACCLAWEGRFEESLAAVHSLGEKKLSRNLRYAVLSLQAGALLMLERDPAGVVRRLDEASRIRTADYDLLRRAHALLSLEKTAEAMSAFERAEALGRRRLVLGMVVLIDGEIQRSGAAYLRGWFLHRIGRDAEARADLARAARSPRPTVYVTRAQELLASLDPPPTESDDARSTLAPHVVS